MCMTRRKNEPEAEVHCPCGSRPTAEKVAMVRRGRKSRTSVALVAARHGLIRISCFTGASSTGSTTRPPQPNKGDRAIPFPFRTTSMAYTASTIPYS